VSEISAAPASGFHPAAFPENRDPARRCAARLGGAFAARNGGARSRGQFLMSGIAGLAGAPLPEPSGELLSRDD